MLKGVGASAGIGIGKVICIREQNLDYSQVQYQGREQEKARLKQAVETFCEKTQRMAEDASGSVRRNRRFSADR